MAAVSITPYHRYTGDDEPLDLKAWAAVVAKNFLAREHLSVWIEPGAYAVQDAGILLVTVNSVEQKHRATFAGVDAGFNIACEPAVYQLPLHPVPALHKSTTTPPRRVTIAGHINEALDVFYKEIELQELAEDDTLALLNAGAYAASMASNHCMRGEFKEFLLLE